ncbi:MAG: hypothetical protein KIH64_012755, partial [Mycobacterium sp.]|nr:hypothetical protein [Mycobacterium sp.]
PLLYEIAQGARLPAFPDITLGGNSVNDAPPGYDLVPGLGTPTIANLAADRQPRRGPVGSAESLDRGAVIPPASLCAPAESVFRSAPASTLVPQTSAAGAERNTDSAGAKR